MQYFINLYEGTLWKVTRKSIFQNIKFVSSLKNAHLNGMDHFLDLELIRFIACKKMSSHLDRL